MEAVKGLKDFIKTKKYRQALDLPDRVEEVYEPLAQGEYNKKVGAVLSDDDDVVCQVADGADGDAVLTYVSPQDLVRVVVARVGDVGQHPGVHGDRGEAGWGCGTGVVLRCVGAHTTTLPCVGD